MKRILIGCATAAALAIASSGALAAESHGGRGNWSGANGNWSGGHGGRFDGGFRGHGFHGHGFRGFGSIYLGSPWYWGSPYYYYDYPAYSYYAAPAYYDYPTEVYVEPPASAPRPASRVQYYCPDSGYYPTVKACPNGWLRVLPGDTDPQ